MRIIEFETEYRANKDPLDWVTLAPAGADFEKTRTKMRIKDIEPPENLRNLTADDMAALSDTQAAMAARWQVVGPAYEAWKRNEEIPLDGTPLAQWPGVTQAQAEVLRNMGVRTVEDVTELDDAALSTLRWPNARKLPDMAAKYLSGQDVAAKDAELAEVRAQLNTAMEMLTEKTEPAEKKRGPGRPRKDEAA